LAPTTALTVTITDPQLAAVVEDWPGLPPGMRAGIFAMVKAQYLPEVT
jgi:hypothetical protein